MTTNHRFTDLSQRGLGAPRVVAIGCCANGGAFRVLAAPTDWPTPAEIEEICERLRYMDKFAAAIRALMDEQDYELYLGLVEGG